MKRFSRKLLPTIARLIENGGSYNSIAKTLGVMPSTLKRWEKRHQDLFHILTPAYKRNLIA